MIDFGILAIIVKQLGLYRTFFNNQKNISSQLFSFSISSYIITTNFLDLFSSKFSCSLCFFNQKFLKIKKFWRNSRFISFIPQSLLQLLSTTLNMDSKRWHLWHVMLHCFKKRWQWKKYCQRNLYLVWGWYYNYCSCSQLV